MIEKESKLDIAQKTLIKNFSSDCLSTHAFSVSKKTAPSRTLQEVTAKLKLEYKRSETPLLYKPSDEEHEAVYIDTSSLISVKKWLDTNKLWTSKKQSLESLNHESCSFKSKNSAFKEFGDSKRTHRKKSVNRMPKINMYGENHTSLHSFKTKK